MPFSFILENMKMVICRILALIGFKVEEKYSCSFSLSLYVCMAMPVSVSLFPFPSLSMIKNGANLNVIWHPRWDPGTKEGH